MPEQGEVIAGRYRLVSLVGRGSMGVVWQAHDERLGRVVAVKFLSAAVDSPDAVERIVREGRVAARLRHPHAISVHDVVEHDGKPCLVLEYLPSRSLQELIAERGPLPEALVATIGSQVASALAAAHAASIVHRDVSSFNVLLAEDGTAKIADFGIARAVGEGTVSDARVIVGTPAFLAPEVAAGEEATFASDVFSLGSTLYAVLEGGPPFGTVDNPYALLRRVSAGEITPPRSNGPLAEVLLRILRRDPAQRPTMAEAHTLLAAVAEGRSVPGTAQVRPPGGTMLLPAPRRVRWRTIVTVAGAAALVASGIVIGTALQDGEQANSAQSPTSTTTTTATTTAATRSCDARFEVINSWQGGYQVQVTVHNAGARKLTDWTVTWSQPAGHTIGNLWDGTLTQDATSVTVSNANYNAVLPAEGSTTFGFTGSGTDLPRPEVTCTSGE
ncbi:serine/threonine protein kinase [Saccharothrix sp. ALI-22-I]|uniref:protein kinase domain-containing protein n=1 Tax=Saccharothrix sp. ALI-22-I TaxID=1933778 RepID=UPI00097BFF66|nr:protein kinase [Saccharothrix sp. ALI-22-I]ONI84770.1 serine/threonine protein kinase [Saccharothrix sp. ALI-22-I]